MYKFATWQTLSRFLSTPCLLSTSDLTKHIQMSKGTLLINHTVKNPNPLENFENSKFRKSSLSQSISLEWNKMEKRLLRIIRSSECIHFFWQFRSSKNGLMEHQNPKNFGVDGAPIIWGFCDPFAFHLSIFHFPWWNFLVTPKHNGWAP